MKNFLLIAVMLLTTFSISAQEKKDKKPLLSPRAFVKTADINISYGQPSKRDREIFGALVPYGEVWRAGANEATEITFKKDMMFGGTAVPAGTYSLFAIPNENQWTIILNGQLGQWGAFEYDKYKSKDAAHVDVPVQKLGKVQEKLVYEVKKDTLKISWDKTSVSVPVTVKK